MYFSQQNAVFSGNFSIFNKRSFATNLIHTEFVYCDLNENINLHKDGNNEMLATSLGHI